MSLSLLRVTYLQSLACVFAMSLVAVGCGPSDNTKAARTESVAAPEPVTKVQTVPVDEGNGQMSAEAILQQCLKRGPVGGKADEGPPVDAGGHFPAPVNCEECTKDWLRTNQSTLLRREARDDAPEAGRVAANNWVQVLEDVALTKPTRGVVVVPGGGLQACDVVFSIDTVFEEGEHVHDRVWRDGKLYFVGIESAGVAGEDGEGVAGTDRVMPIVRFDETPVSGFTDNRWVKLRGPGGETGWARAQSDSFGCMWSDDRYLNDKPTICANPPPLPAAQKN